MTKKHDTPELGQGIGLDTNKQSFESIIEQVDPECIKGYDFQTSKRKAGCCSTFMYWYANTLVESVN